MTEKSKRVIPSQGDVEPMHAQKQLKKLLSLDDYKALCQERSDSEGLKQFCFHFGLIFAAAFAMVKLEDFYHSGLLAKATYWSAFLALSFFLSFLFTGMHECVHGTAFRSEIMNKAASYLFGLLTTRGPRHYWYYHWAHHRYTGDAKMDPELQNTFIDIHIEGYFTYLIYLSGIPFWMEQVMLFVRSNIGGKKMLHEYYLQSANAQRELVWDARFFLFVYSSLFAVSLVNPVFRQRLLFLWILPSIVGQSHLRFYLLAEHRGCHSDASDMYSNTRTTTTNWFYAKLAWYMPYHIEHHAWPQIPFHKLPELHARLKDVMPAGGCTPKGAGGYVNIHGEYLSQLTRN